MQYSLPTSVISKCALILMIYIWYPQDRRNMELITVATVHSNTHQIPDSRQLKQYLWTIWCIWFCVHITRSNTPQIFPQDFSVITVNSWCSWFSRWVATLSNALTGTSN